MAQFNAKSKELGESQDMYRRNLAAFWVAQPGELPADECIENIFAGGDGWGPDAEEHHKKHSGHRHGHHPKKSSVTDSTPPQRSSRQSAPRAHATAGFGRASLEQHANEMKAEAAKHDEYRPHEVDEFDVREDLRSWHIDPDRYTAAVS